MDKKLTWFETLLLFTCFSAAFAAIYMSAAFYYPGEKHGDTATWVGAFFAGAAFAGTIWISTSSDRRRQEELRVRAAIALPALAGYVTNMSAHCGAIATSSELWLSTPRCQSSKYDAQKTWSGILHLWISQGDKIPSIPDSYLTDASAISFPLVGEIQATQADISTGLTYLHSMDGEDIAQSWESAQWIKERFSGCYENLEKCKKEIDRLKTENGWPAS